MIMNIMSMMMLVLVLVIPANKMTLPRFCCVKIFEDFSQRARNFNVENALSCNGVLTENE